MKCAPTMPLSPLGYQNNSCATVICAETMRNTLHRSAVGGKPRRSGRPEFHWVCDPRWTWAPRRERLPRKLTGFQEHRLDFQFVVAGAILYPGKPARSIACCINPDALACSINSVM